MSALSVFHCQKNMRKQRFKRRFWLKKRTWSKKLRLPPIIVKIIRELFWRKEMSSQGKRGVEDLKNGYNHSKSP